MVSDLLSVSVKQAVGGACFRCGERRQAGVQICHRPRADLPCHDGHPGRASPPPPPCRSRLPRLTPIFSWHAVTACYKPGYAIGAAKLEVEEAEEDECGVSWEAPTHTHLLLSLTPPARSPPAIQLAGCSLLQRWTAEPPCPAEYSKEPAGRGRRRMRRDEEGSHPCSDNRS